MTANDNFPLALPDGTVLAGQYVITGVLGQGGFGITYQAQDHKRDLKVAIKEFFPDSMATRSQGQTTVMPFTGDRGDNFEYGKQCFLQEAETLAQFIGNENIVRIYSYFEEYGTAYFVMDYIDGKSLDDYIKEKGGKLSFEETSEILLPVMDALGAVHEKGIVHRDVAPDNIYLTKDGNVKLLDFGAARQSLGDKSQSLDVVLKHGFAPKEQYTRRGRQGPYTDVYALGATFYFALTGKRPPDSLERLDEDDIVLPSTFGVKIPRQAEEAIMIALNVRAEDRFRSMRAFKEAMHSVQGTKPDSEILTSTKSISSNVTQQRFFTAPEETHTTSPSAVGQTEFSNTSSITNSVQKILPTSDIAKKGIKTAFVVVGGILALVGVLFIVLVFRFAGNTNISTSEDPTTAAIEQNESNDEVGDNAVPIDQSEPNNEMGDNAVQTEQIEPTTEMGDNETPIDVTDDDSKITDDFCYKVPWGTSADETLAQLGNGYKLETFDGVKYISGGYMASDIELAYFGAAKGQVEERHACDVVTDGQKKWEGLCYVDITVWSFTQSDVDTIISNHNTLFGSPVVSDTSNIGYMRWEAKNIVVVMSNFNMTEGFDTGSLMNVTWYPKAYFDSL